MAIENFDEIKNYFDKNSDSDDVKNYVGSFVTTDRVSKFLESDEGKKLIQPTLDQYATKAVKSHDEKFKTNELPKLINDAVAKANPQETPEQKQIRELTERLNQKEAAEKHNALVNKAMKEMTDKKLPVDLVHYFIGEDENTTSQNIKKFENILNAHDEEIKTNFAKGNSYTPPSNNKNSGLGEIDKLKKQIHDSLNKR